MKAGPFSQLAINPVMVKMPCGTGECGELQRSLTSMPQKDCYRYRKYDGRWRLPNTLQLQGKRRGVNHILGCQLKKLSGLVFMMDSEAGKSSIFYAVVMSEISGRNAEWKFELEGYDIQYRPRTAIKGQILADFIVERPEEDSPDELMTELEVLPEPWTLFTDGSSCVDGSGAGARGRVEGNGPITPKKEILDMWKKKGNTG
ncbi:hypothetical protein Tco_0216274 [Tanacetum coccineum]